MNSELARKRPANAPRTYRTQAGPRPARVLPRQVAPDIETWTDGRHRLAARVRRAVARGEVAEVSEWRPVSTLPGFYSVRVRRLKPEPPAWRKPAMIAGCAVASLAGLVVSMISLLPAWFGFALIGFGALWAVAALARLFRPRSAIVINQVVNVRK